MMVMSYNRIQENVCILKTWRVKVVNLLKKGDEADVDNPRGRALLSPVGKMVCNILTYGVETILEKEEMTSERRTGLGKLQLRRSCVCNS